MICVIYHKSHKLTKSSKIKGLFEQLKGTLLFLIDLFNFFFALIHVILSSFSSCFEYAYTLASSTGSFPCFLVALSSFYVFYMIHFLGS